MTSVVDYISAILLTIVGIAAFLNVRKGTFVEWLRAKFLGKPGTVTPFTPAAA